MEADPQGSLLPSNGQKPLENLQAYHPSEGGEGAIIFQLDSVITDKHTGVLSTRLTATFYAAAPNFPAAPSADLIVPLASRSKNSSQMLVYPAQAEVTATLPINAAEAWLEVTASGAAREEFWYTNVLDRWSDYIPDAGLIGKGPLREAQPLLWRPLASLRAFDIPFAILDLSPFLPMLSDGQPHTFAFSVLRQGKNSAVNDNGF
ncbi:hypothetical protein JCM3770_004685 [Rhodotorula araucariae]